MATFRTGIQVDPEELRAIELKSTRKGLRLSAFGLHKLSSEERDSPGGALRALIKSAKISATAARYCLPQELATLRYVTLPSKDRAELAGMARFEAERHIPFNAERHLVGYQIARELDLEGSEVLLAVADEPHVARVMDAASEAGVTPNGLTVSSACLMNALAHAEPQLASDQVVMTISIGLQSLELCFSVQGRLVFARSVPHGLRGLIRELIAPRGGGAAIELDRGRVGTAARMIDMMDLDGGANAGEESPPRQGSARSGDAARAWAEKLIKEIRTSYDYARRELDCPPVEALVLTGEGAIVRNLGQYLFVNLNLPVTTLNPVAGLEGAETKDLPFGGLELVAAFGAAIQDAGTPSICLDLVPAAYYRRLDQRRLIRSIGVSALFLAVALILALSSFSKYQKVQDQVAQAYESINREMIPVVDKVKGDEEKLQILRRFIDDPTDALKVIDTLGAYSNIPERMTLTQISYTKAAQVIIEGHARAIADINDFRESLIASGLFELVRIRDQKLKRALRNRPEVYVFRIQGDIPEYIAKREKPDKGRPEAGKDEASEPASGATPGDEDASKPTAGGLPAPPPPGGPAATQGETRP